MSSQAMVRKFSAAIEHAYTQKVPRVDDQLAFDRQYPSLFKKEYDAAVRTVIAVKEPRVLDDLSKSYLDLFFKYTANRNNVRYYRSDQTFYELFERCKKISTEKQNLFKEWSTQLERSDSRLKQRFAVLGQTYQSKIVALVPKPAPKAKKILDYLREEYQKQKGYAHSSDADLYGFDPYDSPTLKKEFVNELAVLQRLWNKVVKGNERMPRMILHGALDNYRTFLSHTAKQGLLRLFQIIKYLQDMLITKRENMGSWVRRYDGDRSPLTCELYAMACLQLLVVAQGKLALPSNRKTFTPEERAYLLKPLRDPDYTYISNIEDRFRRPLGDVGKGFGLTKTFLDLMLLTKNEISRATLVPHAETLAVQGFWAEVRGLTKQLEKAGPSDIERLKADPNNVRLAQKLVERLSIEVPVGQQNLGIAYARVGASPGFHEKLGTITIVDINPRNTRQFIVEYEALKPYLFQVDVGYIGDKVYGSRIYQVHKNTAGMMYVVAGQFLIMGFIPVLIEAGFAGLIYEVLVFFAASELEDAASEINPVFGKIVGLAAQIAVPRPNFKPKVVEPAGLRARPQEKVLALESKAGTATQDKATRQFGEAWLDRTTTKREIDLRGIAGKTNAPAAAPKTQGTGKLVEAPTGRGEAGATVDQTVASGVSPQPRYPRQQGLQQQQTRVQRPDTTPPTTTKVADSRPARPKKQQDPPVGVRLQKGESVGAGPSSGADATAGKMTADRRIANTQDRNATRAAGPATSGRPIVERRPVVAEWQGRGGSYRIIGDQVRFEACQRGYHVYEFLDAQGRTLYVGKAGSIRAPSRIEPVPKGVPEPPFNSFTERLRQDHINKPWINDAKRVRVTYEVSESEMYALEELVIDANRASKVNWNQKPGEFSSGPGRHGADLYSSYQSARKAPSVMFEIEAFTRGWQ